MEKNIELIIEKLTKSDVLDDSILELLHNLDTKLELANKIEECLYDSDLYLVYMHTVPNGKVYIGITQNHPQTRWNEGGGYEKQTKFYKAIQKYGWINIKHEILAAGLTKEEAEKIENDLIIKLKSYDDKYGYNTRVKLENEQKPVIQEKEIKKFKYKSKEKIKKQPNLLEISQKLIMKYDIKTYKDDIYYLVGENYVLERNHPILEKDLLSVYEIPLKKHKEIMRQIKILTHTEDSIPNFKNSCKSSLNKWIDSRNITIDYLISNDTTSLYKNYLEWCELTKENDILGKKTFFKILCEKFNFTRKQKTDSKRYFVIQK